MHFAASSDDNIDFIWDQIVKSMSDDLAKLVCPNSSSFITTNDGLECMVRSASGDLLANCYSEDDRMGGRRWTIDPVMPINS
ncbi:hypothetical protein SynBIOSU31_02927 [Synechococcus sp. BIOS-U3-1]|uniref:hypothetical protein n=1 Tax=Synechococcus sp. BIOS-U3-1 TaxID=1400865 RepID=UPI0016444B41|nr:hypothetical protein [Synechococcus sp. BIOS-U3-1]QNI59782.1 hypothetical protein SynBIOSU31_02927 [Synechococcus sp. BIOS-U3-1]|tara:strand:+ start:6355 stop:6600 length:246 start_codon:yes stop_codon:yes gene_type:complete